MTERMNELMRLFKREDCDYNRCRELIRDIGGGTKIVSDTTALHEAALYGHYAFAMELIRESGADLNVVTEDWGPLLWEFQYLWSETETEACEESRQKLRIVRAMIEAGANPNPMYDGESLLNYVNFSVFENEGPFLHWRHRLWMSHIIEAHAYGETDHCFEKLNRVPIRTVLVFDNEWTLWEDHACECDHVIFVFEDGERMALSGYACGDGERDFYAVFVNESQTLSGEYYKNAFAGDGKIALLSEENGEALPPRSLRLLASDTVVQLQPKEGSIRLTM